MRNLTIIQSLVGVVTSSLNSTVSCSWVQSCGNLITSFNLHQHNTKHPFLCSSVHIINELGLSSLLQQAVKCKPSFTQHPYSWTDNRQSDGGGGGVTSAKTGFISQRNTTQLPSSSAGWSPSTWPSTSYFLDLQAVTKILLNFFTFDDINPTLIHIHSYTHSFPTDKKNWVKINTTIQIVDIFSMPQLIQ